MNAKFDAPCRFYIQGNCREGDQCKYSHDTSNIEKVNLDRNDKGKLNLRKNNDFQNDKRNQRGRGRGRGTSERYKDDDQGIDNYKNDEIQKSKYQQQKNSYEQRDYQKFGQQQEENKDRQLKQKQDRNFNKQENQNQQSIQRERNNVNSKRWDRRQDNDNGDEQKQYRQFTRGGARGRGGRDNTFVRREYIQDQEKEKGDQSEQQIENISLIKKVKKNEIQVKSRNQVLKLEQKINIDDMISIVGYNFQFLGILKSSAIDFYQIPFKRTGIQIIDEEKRATISRTDDQFISAFIQEHSNNEFTLIIQFQRGDKSFKNLMIFDNVFHQQFSQEIIDISVKEIVYTNFEDKLLYTFCKDGLIRIFQQNGLGQFKYTQHYNVEQSIESVIKVGSNYLIGTRSCSLYLFNGTVITEIPYKFSQECTQMIIDFNRVILKMDDDQNTLIYILNQKLEIIGPIYEGERVISLELIKSYESDKLFILGLRDKVQIYTEIENKLHLINVILNQKFKQIKKIEITNENMVTQKFIVGENNGELKIYSVVPEQ